MKKLFTSIAILCSIGAFAQPQKPKADTIIAITMTLDQFRAVLFEIDKNIDSKSISKQLLEFFQKSAKMVEDKPKEKIK